MVLVKMSGTDGISYCGTVRNNAGLRYKDGVVYGLAHAGTKEGPAINTWYIVGKKKVSVCDNANVSIESSDDENGT